VLLAHKIALDPNSLPSFRPAPAPPSHDQTPPRRRERGGKHGGGLDQDMVPESGK
jgi:hypothetical protein